ncbi:ABC transporter permease [Terrimonas alba]|uniref:ABC transporter permease n=1 Tax=Terrimonas alba TaxID=3349636 RepID=UPI0035F4B76F
MIKNYFKTAWRNLTRNKVFSALNIFGLATGMAVALLIGLWVYDQSSYDSFLPGYRQAYQVKYNYNNDGDIRTQSEVCLPLADVLKNDIPEVAWVAPAFGTVTNTLGLGDKKVHPRGIIGGEDFLKIFQFPAFKGDVAGALKDPYSIVLTESTAKALFGNEDALNKIIRIDNAEDRKVTAVLKDVPRNSSFQFDYITAFSAFASGGWVKAATTNWNHNFFRLYIALKPNASYEQAASKSKMLVKKYAPEIYNTFHQQLTLQPLQDWHFYTDYKNGVAVGGLIDYVRMFSIIGLLVLIIACINFMNLSTARSEKRAKEVGIRKTIGSQRSSLVVQFLIESLVITFAAFMVSLLLVQVSLPWFNALTGAAITIPFSNIAFWFIMLGYVLVTGLLAGSRPAFYLSSFQPIKVLKGAMQTGKSATLPRKALVVLQFSCSIALIISTIIVYQQIQHAKARPRGYDPNRLLVTEGNNWYYNALKQEVLQTGVVSSMTKSMSPVTEIYSRNNIDDWEGRLPNEPLTLAMNSVPDTDYFKTVGMKIKEGRNFTGNFAVDSLSVILNEAAVKRMRFKEPINQIINWSLSNAPNRLRVIGVVNDALTNSPFSSAEPMMFVYQPDWTFHITFRLVPTVSTQSALAKLKPIFDKYRPDTPFEYHFVDESYAAKFNLEMLIGKLAALFSALAIFISCLGLFGLAAYMAEQRKKEIGIRKVLGASVSEVWLLLSKEFIVLVIISCVVASPIAFFYLQNWLQQYDYRININPVVFVLAGIVAIVVTIITISFQAIKAAIANPVKSLRTE